MQDTPPYKKAVILLNMGGPNSLDEVPIFLKNMFDDPCILSIKNGFFRSMVGNMIVNSRIQKSRKIYEQIGGASPLTPITFSLTQKLQSKTQDTFYTYAMRYTPPYAYHVLQDIMQKHINDIVLFSMYPQYSTTTTYSSFEDIAKSLKQLDFNPQITLVDRYYNNALFIKCIVDSIIAHLRDCNASDFALILSAHSIPLSRIKSGDPYQKECEISRDLIKDLLQQRNIFFKDIVLSYQSKLGPVKWIGPSTEDIIKSLKSNIIVYPLSFSIDNSETIYELCKLYKGLADSSGIKDYRVCECLNDSDSFVGLIESLCIES